MEARTEDALNRSTTVDASDTNYGTVMARGIRTGSTLTPGSSSLTSGVLYLVQGTPSGVGGVCIGQSGKAQSIGEMFFGVGGKARKVVAAYIGVSGKARQFFSAGIPVAVSITGTGYSTDVYVEANGKSYTSAASVTLTEGAQIVLHVRGYNATYPGYITVNGTEVKRVTSNTTTSYTYTIPEGKTAVSINMTAGSTTQSKTTYHYGSIDLDDE